MDSIFSLFVSVFKSADMALWARLLYEVFDFMVKAAVFYKETEQGAKEWDDFASRYEIAINNGANDNIKYGVEETAQPEQPKDPISSGRLVRKPVSKVQ